MNNKNGLDDLLENSPLLVPDQYFESQKIKLKDIPTEHKISRLPNRFQLASIAASLLLLASVFVLIETNEKAPADEISSLELYLFIEEHISDYSYQDLLNQPYNTYEEDSYPDDLDDPFESALF